MYRSSRLAKSVGPCSRWVNRIGVRYWRFGSTWAEASFLTSMKIVRGRRSGYRRGLPDSGTDIGNVWKNISYKNHFKIFSMPLDTGRRCGDGMLGSRGSFRLAKYQSYVSLIASMFPYFGSQFSFFLGLVPSK